MESAPGEGMGVAEPSGDTVGEIVLDSVPEGVAVGEGEKDTVGEAVGVLVAELPVEGVGEGVTGTAPEA